MNAKKLFWQIVNCPWSDSCDACKQVLSEQDGLSCRQVPEPWSGDIETATFMGLGANPAIDSDEYRRAKGKKLKGHTEVFPSRAQDGRSWMNVLPNSRTWTDADVYNFFHGRFNDAECPGVKKKYVAIGDRIEILKIDKGGCARYFKPKNEYWAAYVKYSGIINEKLKLGLEFPILGRDVIVTDVVHCKGSSEKGVTPAMPWCKKYTYNILNLFVNNSAPQHVLMVYGAEKTYSSILKLLSEIWEVGAEEEVGDYDRKSKEVYTHKKIFRRKCLDRVSKKEIAVYYGIPKPSGSNRACQNIVLHGTAVNDKVADKHQGQKIKSESGFELKELNLRRPSKSRRRYHDLLAE